MRNDKITEQDHPSVLLIIHRSDITNPNPHWTRKWLLIHTILSKISNTNQQMNYVIKNVCTNHKDIYQQKKFKTYIKALSRK